MKNWVPEHPGNNKSTVFIIGGGSSLRDFNWTVLEPLSTIGCNHAFRFGSKVCDELVFGDHKFFRRFRNELSAYEGPVITNNNHLFTVQKEIPWVICTKKQRYGLHTYPYLGWNGNTGSLAINVALVQGFTTIALLGFDMALDNKQRPNYHEHIIDVPSESAYARFKREGKHVEKDLRNKFPHVQVYNLNPDSTWDTFPKITFKDFMEMEGREHAVAI